MEKILAVEHVKKYFPVEKSFIERIFSKNKLYVRAVDDVSFDLMYGEVLGLVGESGSGKTTTGLMIVGLLKPTAGRIIFRGIDISNLDSKELKQIRRKIQMIFQDPMSSLDPRMKIGEAVEEPLKIHGVGSSKERRELVVEVLQKVGLGPALLDRFPHELSGGQRQRAVIATWLLLSYHVDTS
ncbi:MAG: dipeptide/oligopeptide/nickel ABC transporter ATP-binding protein [Candidatus Caldarchaeales archaeon]